MAPEALEPSTQPGSCPPVKSRGRSKGWRVQQQSPAEKSTQGEDEGRAGDGIFYELEKLGFFVSGVGHGGMARGLIMIFNHCAHHYRACWITVAFAMIFPARKREKSGTCQNFIQETEFAQAISVMDARAQSEMNLGPVSPSNWRRQPRLSERACLPFGQGGGRKFAHRLMEQLVEIQPRVEM
jgi:hypothetical protein